MRRLLAIVVAALFSLNLSPLHAEEKAATTPVVEAKSDAPSVNDPKAPDTSKIMFIQNLRRIGASLYYMGEALGLNGWLVIKDKQLQILYTTLDGRAVTVGALLSAEGANVSQQQILALASKYPEVANVLREGQGATVRVADDGKPPVTPDAPRSEQVFSQLASTTRVTFGKKTAPLIYMVMDVHCYYCHQAWKKLEKYVDSGRIQISMIPINALGPQSEVDAANWLNKKDPLDAWKKYMAGDTKILQVGDQDPEKEKAIFENTELAKKWGVDKTPYLFYRGVNGKVRLIVGAPQDIDALLQDVK